MKIDHEYCDCCYTEVSDGEYEHCSECGNYVCIYCFDLEQEICDSCVE